MAIQQVFPEHVLGTRRCAMLQAASERHEAPGTNREPTNVKYDTSVCTPVFAAALLTVAEKWKQPKCPLMGDGVKNIQPILKG